jgi:hypothetical protein
MDRNSKNKERVFTLMRQQPQLAILCFQLGNLTDSFLSFWLGPEIPDATPEEKREAAMKLDAMFEPKHRVDPAKKLEGNELANEVLGTWGGNYRWKPNETPEMKEAADYLVKITTLDYGTSRMLD